MILKRPYAFLIKYFKLINLVLSILSGYIIYKTYNIVSFFNDYIHQNYSGNYYSGFFESYISPFLFFILFFIIVGILAIFLLFIYKKKPIKAYLLSIINYIILFIFFNVVKNTMIMLETQIITAETSRIFRDLSLLLIIPQILFFVSFLIRGLGFNIKKFNFQEDLKELEISEKDNEEVEITFKKDGTKLRRNFRRFSREFKYYVKENKFMVIIAILITVLISIFIIYKSIPEKYDQEFKQGESFTIDFLNYNVLDSIVTNIDYNGNIFDDNTYYVIAKLSVENLNNDNFKFDYNNFRLEINNNYVYPSKDKGVNFIDYAENYTSNTIKRQSKQTLLLVYKIDKDEIKNNYKIKISNGSVYNEKGNISKFNYIKITPVLIDKVINEKTVDLNTEVVFKNSNLGDSSITLSNPIITDKYIYNYQLCQNDKCNNYKDVINVDIMNKNSKLLILDYKYNLSEEIPFYKVSTNINGFIKHFIKIKYRKEENILISEVKDVTPAKLKNKIVLETTNEINDAKEIYVSIVIRNKEYLIKIK